MVFKVFLLMVFITTVSSATTKEEDFFVHNHSDDYEDYEYDDKPRDIQTDKPTVIKTDKAKPSYEVTENVDDIPNPVINNGPIVANFTIKLPLNNATFQNNSNVSIDKNNRNDKDDFDNFFNGIINEFDGENPHDNKNKYLKKNSISIFHVNAEFDNDKETKPTIQNIHVNQRPSFGIFNVKDHVDRFRDSIANHIHKLHDNEVYNDVNGGFVVPNIVAGPLSFLSKLQKKGSAVASKLHDVIFGRLDDY
ncbi:uncharacterized protein [Choristoneura fumiferana]|uniref:uncharacterized protein n=1 Tax=Choristoneura fumiferana TaxID=7141 RepID=UPI003D15BC95